MTVGLSSNENLLQWLPYNSFVGTLELLDFSDEQKSESIKKIELVEEIINKGKEDRWDFIYHALENWGKSVSQMGPYSRKNFFVRHTDRVLNSRNCLQPYRFLCLQKGPATMALIKLQEEENLVGTLFQKALFRSNRTVIQPILDKIMKNKTVLLTEEYDLLKRWIRVRDELKVCEKIAEAIGKSVPKEEIQALELMSLDELELRLNDFYSHNMEVIRNINELSIRSLHLVYLPRNLEKLVGLKKLDLSYNYFQSLNIDFCQFPSLHSLDLSWNNLQYIEESILSNKAIRKIDVSRNGWITLPVEFFRENQHIEIIIYPT